MAALTQGLRGDNIVERRNEGDETTMQEYSALIKLKTNCQKLPLNRFVTPP